jgi:flagellar secretion chaperone FliS
MDMYRSRALEGASGVELTIALYDGIVRFMYDAIGAVERHDVEQRRAAVKRAMDIVVHLQATLDRDLGGEPAKALEEFYVAMFALMLQGSQANSAKKFEQVIKNVREVREAWKQVVADPSVNQFARTSLPDALQPNAKNESSWIRQSETKGESSWTV